MNQKEIGVSGLTKLFLGVAVLLEFGFLLHDLNTIHKYKYGEDIFNSTFSKVV
jgi:hypothetical protein